MPELLLTEEQSNLLREVGSRIPVRDATGRVVGYFEPNASVDTRQLDPMSAAVLAKAIERKGKPKEPGIPGEKVQAHLKALEAEWERTGGFDEAYMKAFLAKLREQDAA